MSVHDQRVDEIAAGLSTATRAEAESMAHELAAFRGRDSRIASAAPDMLEALRAAEELYQVGLIPASNELIDRVKTSRRAAIAKATGEAS